MKNLLIFTLSLVFFCVLTLWAGGAYSNTVAYPEGTVSIVYYNADTHTKICARTPDGKIHVIPGNEDVIIYSSITDTNIDFNVPTYSIFTNYPLSSIIKPSVIFIK